MTRSIFMAAAALALIGCADATFDLGDEQGSSETNVSVKPAFDSGDAGRDVGDGDGSLTVDTGADTTPSIDTTPSLDTGSIAIDTGTERTSVIFPSTSSMSTCVGLCNYPGWHVEESFTRSTPVRKLFVDVTVNDGTCGCASGVIHRIAVKVNGVKVGELSFTSETVCGSPLVARRVDDTFTLTTPIAPSSDGRITLRLEALTGVCSGGGQWTFKSGGSAVME